MKTLKRFLPAYIAAILLSAGNYSAFSQNVAINSTGLAPDASAMLDVSSTTSGLLLPRMTAAQRTSIALPATGLLVYQTNGTPGFYYYDGSAWRLLFGPGGWSITGNAGTVAGTNFLGTTDAVQLDFRTANVIRFRLASGQYSIRSLGNGSASIPVYSWNADTDIGMYRAGTNILGFSTSGLERLRLGTTEAVINEQSYDYNFRVESNGQPDMFFIDAGLNRIGINTLSPAGPVHFLSTGENAWLTQWDNSYSVGAAGRFQNTSSSNGNRVLMGTTNYSGSFNAAASVIGLSLNTTTTGSGGYGVEGAANNESGLAVYGTLYHVGFYSGWAGYFDSDVYCGGAYVGSDRRLKKDIQPITHALDIVAQVQPVSYYFNTDKYPGIGLDENRKSFGFVAQDLELVVPEMVKDKNLILNSNVPKDLNQSGEQQSDMFKVVNYTLMIPILTQAIKEQQAIIEDLQKRIETLENK